MLHRIFNTRRESMTRRPSLNRSNSNPDFLELAKSRIRDILSQRVVATTQIFEHLICDMGNLSLEPRIVGMARKTLIRDGELREWRTDRANDPMWFYLPNASLTDVESHIDRLSDVLRGLARQAVKKRRGQCLELAIYRALLRQQRGEYFGQFPNFDPTDLERPNKLYRKEEPPSHIGNRAIPGERPLDFLYMHDSAGFGGIEAKNVRQWLYPDHADIRGFLVKCVALDCVPVLVARRLPGVTIEVLGSSGVVIHQTLNQLYCVADKDLAESAMRQDSLGFDDIRIGDEPDAALSHFIGTKLDNELPVARKRFDKFKDLLTRYAYEKIQYPEFVGRVRLRAAGKDDTAWKNDDQDHPEGSQY